MNKYKTIIICFLKWYHSPRTKKSNMTFSEIADKFLSEWEN